MVQQLPRHHKPPLLSCTGAKCTINRPKNARDSVDAPRAADLEAFLHTLQNVAKDAVLNLDGAVQIVQNETQSSHGVYAAPSKKAILRKLTDRLLKASSQLHQFQVHTMDIKDSISDLQSKLKTTEESHIEALQKVDQLSSDLQTSLKQLSEEKTLKDKVGNALRNPRQVALDDLKQNPREADDAKDSLIEKIRADNCKLKRELEATLKEQVTAAAALEQVERYKEVVAKVTADNMVFLMKLKTTDEELQAVKEKEEELWKQLHNQRRCWFENASIEVEDAVKSSLTKAESCEVELQMLQKNHGNEMKECKDKIETLSASLNSVSIIKENLEARVRTLDKETNSLMQRIEKETVERQNVQVELNVLRDKLDATNLELIDLKTRHAHLLEEMNVRSKDLHVKQGEMDQMSSTFKNTFAQLETQRAINSTLMKKKEEMEWLCLEAQAEREKFKQQLRSFVQI